MRYVSLNSALGTAFPAIYQCGILQVIDPQLPTLGLSPICNTGPVSALGLESCEQSSSLGAVGGDGEDPVVVGVSPSTLRAVGPVRAPVARSPGCPCSMLPSGVGATHSQQMGTLTLNLLPYLLWVC